MSKSMRAAAKKIRQASIDVNNAALGLPEQQWLWVRQECRALDRLADELIRESLALGSEGEK